MTENEKLLMYRQIARQEYAGYLSIKRKIMLLVANNMVNAVHARAILEYFGAEVNRKLVQIRYLAENYTHPDGE